MSTILVIGGTGKVGSRLTPALRARGDRVRVASRTRGEVHFDWREPATHAPALEGADAAFMVGPGNASDWSGLIPPLLQEAVREGLQRIVLLSARAVEFYPDGVLARAEEALRRGPLPWTILRPSHFAQNFTEAMWVPVDGVVSAPVGHGAEAFVDVADVADVAAEILTLDDHAGGTVELSGPTALTFDHAVEILSAHAGRALRFESEDPRSHVDRLRASGTPEEYVRWRMAMLDAIRRGEDAYVSDGVQRVLGRGANSFEAWAAREAGALTSR